MEKEVQILTISDAAKLEFYIEADLYQLEEVSQGEYDLKRVPLELVKSVESLSNNQNGNINYYYMWSDIKVGAYGLLDPVVEDNPLYENCIIIANHLNTLDNLVDVFLRPIQDKIVTLKSNNNGNYEIVSPSKEDIPRVYFNQSQINN